MNEESTIIESREIRGDNGTDLPSHIRVQIAKLIDNHYNSVQGRTFEPFHVDIVIHMREQNTGEELPPIRVVHVFASKHKQHLHPYIFEATKSAIDVRIRMVKEELAHAATSS